MENRPRNQDITHDLISAVREGNLERSRELINSYGLSYSQEWSQGYILLCDALRNKHAEVAKLLLTNGSEVNSNTKDPVDTPLHLAIINGDADIVRMILDNGPNVEATNKDDQTPLHVAVQMGCLQIVEILLEYGADFDCACLRGRHTPLHFAAQKGYAEIITLLLSRGADVNVADIFMATPLYIAIKNGYIRIAEHLLNHGACTNTSTFLGYTALHVASEGDDEEAVNLLLNRGADINARTIGDLTPLDIATKESCRRVEELLSVHDNNADNQDKNGKTRLYLAVEEGNLAIVEDILKDCPDIDDRSNRNSLKLAVQRRGEEYRKIVEALLKYGITVNPEDAINPRLLHTAVERSYLKIVEELINYGADINASDTYGRTALHFTVEDVADIDIKVRIAKLFLSKGANVNAQNRNGKTTLHVAIEGGHAKVVEVLLEYNANVNCEDECRDTPLSLSVQRGNEGITLMLLNKGANVNAREAYEWSLLHEAIVEDHKEIVKVLLEWGAKVNSKTVDNWTPLHFAVQRNCSKTIKALLEFGADIDSRLDDGSTALHLASYSKNYRVVAILVEYGSDINTTCRNNRTPLDYAIRRLSDSQFEDYHPEYGHYCNPFEVVVETLKRHIVKVKAANLYASERNLRAVRWAGMNGFENECVEERARMNEKINNSEISFYDIMTQNTMWLVRNMENQNVVEILESNDYKAAFPIYGNMIENNFRKGMIKKEFLEQSHTNLHILFNNLPKLPPEIIQIIIDYLSDEDLRRLDKCLSTS